MSKNVLTSDRMFALLAWCQRSAAEFPTTDATVLARRASANLGFQVTRANVLTAGSAAGLKTAPQIRMEAMASAPPQRRVSDQPRRRDRSTVLAAAIMYLYDQLGEQPSLELRSILEHRPV